MKNFKIMADGCSGDKRERVKPDYFIGCTGHINLARIKNFDEERVRGEIRNYFNFLNEGYCVTLFCGLADGADAVFAEEALNCGVKLVAVLPGAVNEYVKEHGDAVKFNALLARSSEVLIVDGYVGVMNYMLSRCAEIIAMWDGVKLELNDENGRQINRGGTYDTVRNAVIKNLKVKIFN